MAGDVPGSYGLSRCVKRSYAPGTPLQSSQPDNSPPPPAAASVQGPDHESFNTFNNHGIIYIEGSFDNTLYHVVNYAPKTPLQSIQPDNPPPPPPPPPAAAASVPGPDHESFNTFNNYGTIYIKGSLNNTTYHVVNSAPETPLESSQPDNPPLPAAAAARVQGPYHGHSTIMVLCTLKVLLTTLHIM